MNDLISIAFEREQYRVRGVRIALDWRSRPILPVVDVVNQPSPVMTRREECGAVLPIQQKGAFAGSDNEDHILQARGAASNQVLTRQSGGRGSVAPQVSAFKSKSLTEPIPLSIFLGSIPDGYRGHEPGSQGKSERKDQNRRVCFARGPFEVLTPARAQVPSLVDSK